MFLRKWVKGFFDKQPPDKLKATPARKVNSTLSWTHFDAVVNQIKILRKEIESESYLSTFNKNRKILKANTLVNLIEETNRGSLPFQVIEELKKGENYKDISAGINSRTASLLDYLEEESKPSIWRKSY